MVSELRSRKLKPAGDTPLNSKEKKRKHDDTESDHAKPASFVRRFVEWDTAATLKCSICASPNSGHLRYFFQLLEVSGHGVPWIAIPVALMCYSADPWLHELLVNLLAGIFLDLLIIFILKAVVRRPRPPVNQNDMFLAVSVDSQFSFPSGHCTRVGMLVYFFIANLSLTVPQLALFSLWTVGIASSRLCLGRHYVTDVTCGILIGLLQGTLIQYYWMPIEKFHHLKTYFT